MNRNIWNSTTTIRTKLMSHNTHHCMQQTTPGISTNSRRKLWAVKRNEETLRILDKMRNYSTIKWKSHGMVSPTDACCNNRLVENCCVLVSSRPTTLNPQAYQADQCPGARVKEVQKTATTNLSAFCGFIGLRCLLVWMNTEQHQLLHVILVNIERKMTTVDFYDVTEK